MPGTELLHVEDLRVLFKGEDSIAVGVNQVSFTVHEGVNLALIGESGSGKSVTSLACMRLLDENSSIARGGIYFGDLDITRLEEKQMEKLRGDRMSMIFQEPMTSLNPVLTIGFQLSESLRLHTDMSKKDRRDRCLELLALVGIADKEKALAGFPHELSGGMRQRVMIAMALACNPKLLIADEPTTALDVTIQAQILSLLRRLQDETGITIMIITHDFGVVAEMADEVVVMYAGFAVETGTVYELFEHPIHPYTAGLLKSLIPLDANMDVPLYTIPGIVPRITLEQKNCPFMGRCPRAVDFCAMAMPGFTQIGDGHFVRCFNGFL
ncbi:MAG: ABC transporter ATP-binding protein [Spirochaetaceae bacterium]|jgi:oligopeptide/dipeptide ABC transporter ATP-binding protein|nr:ABC transporter ATP-binding protein [Spirochaetaceae bacterium]